jgi:hypothetical protein
MLQATRRGGRSFTVDLAVIVVSANDARWLGPCLSSVYAHAGGAALDVVVVANGCSDDTAALVRREFPAARLIEAPNEGFAAGNNRALEGIGARYALLLNPDTEILQGSFAELVELLDARPLLGVAGVRQVGADGALHATIRRFPSAPRALGEALGCERWPLRPSWAGERVLDPGAYAREGACDWTSGSFLLARREALLAAGLLDERFFLYCEEPDLCLRVRRAGWQVRHLPQMTIRHHAGKGGVRPRMLAQEAYARRQYARKHFGAAHRGLYLGALALRYGLRVPLRRGTGHALAALGCVRGPFIEPPPTAIRVQAGTSVPRCSGEPPL